MQYEKPVMDVIELEVEDIVCASGLNNGGKATAAGFNSLK